MKLKLVDKRILFIAIVLIGIAFSVTLFSNQENELEGYQTIYKTPSFVEAEQIRTLIEFKLNTEVKCRKQICTKPLFLMSVKRLIRLFCFIKPENIKMKVVDKINHQYPAIGVTSSFPVDLKEVPIVSDEIAFD